MVASTTNYTGLGIKAKTAGSNSGTVTRINTVGGTRAAYSYAITEGTGFTVTGTAGDTSVLNYVIIRNIP